MRHLRLALAALASIVLLHGQPSLRAQGSPAQPSTAPATFTLPSGPQAIAVLDGQWRFHPGDDPHWSEPNLDDSTWTLLRADQPWPSDRYPNLEGYAWYRFKVTVPANTVPLAIELPTIHTSYQLFADGVLVGSPSPLPLNQHILRVHRAVYKLPSASSARTVSFALRVWHWHVWASYYSGGPYGATRVGAESAVLRDAQLITASNAWQQVDREMLAILQAFAGIAALLLFALQTRLRAYLWFGLSMVFSSAEICWIIWQNNHVFWVNASDNIDSTLSTFGFVAAAFFYKDFLDAPNDLLFKVVILAPILDTFFSYFGLIDLLSVPVATLIADLLLLPFIVWIVMGLLRSLRRKIGEVRLLIAPLLLNQAVQLYFSITWILYTFGLQKTFADQDYKLTSWPFRITVVDLSTLLLLLSVVVVLLIRFSRVLREQDRIHTDLQAARTLQQMLIPEEVPETPGWSITTAYHPAQEVGGDFFQIVQVPSSFADSLPDTVVLLGDAAGKGLPAAMTVSMLLGAFRTLVESTSSPAAILGGLNRRLNARGAGFTTAVALRLTASGELTLASAGHLSPYLNGDELTVPPALPLGMDPEETVVEAKLQLEPGDRITLMTDGVPEARKHHELFGFERTRNLSKAPAHDIAAAALHFGQEDDVTVLSLVLV